MMARNNFSGGPDNRGGSEYVNKQSGGERAWAERNQGSGIDQSDRAPPTDHFPGRGTTLGPNPGYLAPKKPK
jgi:hypothetical protein